jgi:hypothetical protein
MTAEAQRKIAGKKIKALSFSYTKAAYNIHPFEKLYHSTS